MFNRMTITAMQRQSMFFPNAVRMFSNRCDTNPVVWMNVTRNGTDLGKMKFEVSILKS